MSDRKALYRWMLGSRVVVPNAFAHEKDHYTTEIQFQMRVYLAKQQDIM